MAIVLVAVIPALLVASIFSAAREADHQIKSRKAELQGIARAFAAAASEAIVTQDQRQVANALKGIGAIPGLNHVSVRDRRDNLIFQFGSGILVSNPTDAPEIFHLRTFPVETEIRNGGIVIGRLLLIADISGIRATLIRSVQAACLTALLAALAGLTFSMRMQRAVVDPIADLTKAMEAVRKEKDFTRKVVPTTEDETGKLVLAFNDMMREIKERDIELEQYRHGLEVQVAERTRDLAKAVEAAQAANSAKSDFLATMSHEIRTPMNGMLVSAELLAASDLPPRAQRHCEVILRSGQTLLSILNDILDLSKIEAGQLLLETVPVRPATVVDDVIRLFSERAVSKGLQLAAYVSPTLPDEIPCDPVRLTQVLSNLVNNALKFTETGGVLVVVESDEAGYLRFAVTDTGIGIPEDKLASVFDPFTQAEQSTTRRFGGTGIGLTICRRLVDAMGGTLGVESKFGQGSTFYFRLPLHESYAASPSCDSELAGKAVALMMPEGPVRTVLERVAGDLGLCIMSPEENGQPQAILACSERLEGLLQGAATQSATICVVTRLGDAAWDHLFQQGKIQGVLEAPFISHDAAEILEALIAGRHHTLACQSDNAPVTKNIVTFPGTRILAADDSPINREVLREALRWLNVEVSFVEDGQAAVDAVASGAFDLVFMDGSMPGLDGFDATRTIRAWEDRTGRPPLPIIGLSAHVIGQRADMWRACGMSDFITKPFTLATIRTCLERWLDRTAPSAEKEDHPVDPAIGRCTLPEAPLLDTSVLQSIRDMQAPGDDLVGRVASLYASHAPDLLERVMECAMSRDLADSLASAAHALKSLSRNVGAIRVGNICGIIEQQASSGALDADFDFMPLRQAVSATIEELALFRGSNAQGAHQFPAQKAS